MTYKHDNFASWAIFVGGCACLIIGAPGLLRFMLTGDTHFNGYRSVPFQLTGSDAALVLAAHTFLGTYLLWVATRRLTGKG